MTQHDPHQTHGPVRVSGLDLIKKVRYLRDLMGHDQDTAVQASLVWHFDAFRLTNAGERLPKALVEAVELMDDIDVILARSLEGPLADEGDEDEEEA